MFNGKINSSAKNIAVIMAGGSGTRFWPLSRANLPKQYLAFGENDLSLIQETYLRLKSTVDDVLVVTAKSQAHLVKQHLPEVCVLSEPVARNTAACVAYTVKFIEQSVGNATILFVPADQKIIGEQKFVDTFSNALRIAEADEVLVTIGIVPTRAETGYGYIKIGSKFNEQSNRVESFVEKPNLEKAKEYLNSGMYLWNSGIFAWKVSTIQKSLATYTPEIFNSISRFFSDDLINKEHQALEAFSKLPSISIDTGVMEKADNVVVLPGKDFYWSDVGSWESWLETSGIKGEENLIKGDVIAIDSKGCGILSQNRLIAAVGLEDIIIVDTEDAILVCKKDRSQDVKKVVEMLKEKGRGSIT